MQGLKKAILDELEMSEILVMAGEEITPRWLVRTAAQQDYVMFTRMKDDMAHRMGVMGMVRAFMIWQKATSFVLSGETITPNAITATAYRQDGSGLVAYRVIEGDPKGFAKTCWLGTEGIDPIVKSVMPSPHDTLTDEQAAECERLFGEGGQFEVKRVLH